MLSGGERLRATLACVLCAEPAPQLLLLDEPTNNLDLVSVGQLESALGAYRGAFVVVSHDERFLAEIGVDRWLRLADGRIVVEVVSSALVSRWWPQLREGRPARGTSGTDTFAGLGVQQMVTAAGGQAAPRRVLELQIALAAYISRW